MEYFLLLSRDCGLSVAFAFLCMPSGIFGLTEKKAFALATLLIGWPIGVILSIVPWAILCRQSIFRFSHVEKERLVLFGETF